MRQAPRFAIVAGILAAISLIAFSLRSRIPDDSPTATASADQRQKGGASAIAAPDPGNSADKHRPIIRPPVVSEARVASANDSADEPVRARGSPVSVVDSTEQGALPTEAELRNAKSAVGRPFPLSKSVRAQCELDVPTSTECPYMRELLEKFAQESRDVAWARDMEARLTRAIARQDAGKFSVRAIECRSTLCFIEVVALYDGCRCFFFDDPDVGQRLHGPLPGNWGFEYGPAGEKFVVTAMGYERH